MTGRRNSAVVSGLLLVVCAGCSDETRPQTPPENGSRLGSEQGAGPEVAAECTPLIRRDGITYRGYGYTSERPQLFSTAEVADCNDTQPNAPGSVFPSDPNAEKVGTFDGFPADEVLGLHFNRKTYSVFIAESITTTRGEAILAELRTSSE